MARGPVITDGVRMLTAKLHNDHPKWTNTMIRNEVLSRVHKRDPSLPKDWPSQSAIDHIMPDIRKRARQSKLTPNPLDQTWTVQSMGSNAYQIPAEALPSVLQVWFYGKQMGSNLSIRQAKWVARLHTAITDIEALYRNSCSASEMEAFAETAGIEDFLGAEAVNLSLLSVMTGHVINEKEARSVGLTLSTGGPKGERIYLDPWIKGFEDNIFEAHIKGYEMARRIKLNRKRGAK